jgi:sorbitol/mannitol transport system substrate-binding protein
VALPHLARAIPSVQFFVSNDIQNLDKLDHDRIQFALIDKFTAADLMVGQRPHLIGQFEFMTPPFAQRDFSIAFSAKRACAGRPGGST